MSGEYPSLRNMYEMGTFKMVIVPTEDWYSLIFPVAWAAVIRGVAIQSTADIAIINLVKGTTYSGS